MFALASASQGRNSTIILIVIAAVILYAHWRTILKIGVIAIVIGYTFLVISGLLDIAHALHSLIP